MTTTTASERPRVLGGALYRPWIDASILLGPWLFGALMAFAWPPRSAQVMAVWLAQFVLGNTTHVILTFLLLALRPEVLRATPAQARVVSLGSLVTFGLTFGLFHAVELHAPNWVGFPTAVIAIFGVHHRLSQAKGVWSLYNLRSARLGAGPPSPRERNLQQVWVSLGLILVVVSWLFIPSGPNRSFPLLQAIPLEPAFLPYTLAYLFAAGWTLFAIYLLAVLWRESRNIAKVCHVGSHAFAVLLALLAPVWGGIVWGAIHGLEYFFLSARMIEGRSGDTRRGVPNALVWPVMIAAMAPIVVVGMAFSPFAASWFASGFGKVGMQLVNACVAAHYFADAFIFRFRIPEVRKVALHRLGFA